MVKYLAKGYLWALLLLLYSPILTFVGQRTLEYVRYRHDSRYGIYLVGERSRYRDL